MKKLKKKVKKIIKSLKKDKGIKMPIFDLVSAITSAINADIAAGLGNFTVALSPDSTKVVLTSTPVGTPPAGKTEEFALPV